MGSIRWKVFLSGFCYDAIKKPEINNAAFVEQVLAALDSDSDNEPSDDDSDIYLLSVDS